MTVWASFVGIVCCQRHRLGSVVVFDFNGACDLFCLVVIASCHAAPRVPLQLLHRLHPLSATYYDTPSTRTFDYPVAEALRSEATRLSTVDYDDGRPTICMYILCVRLLKVCVVGLLQALHERKSVHNMSFLFGSGRRLTSTPGELLRTTGSAPVF